MIYNCALTTIKALKALYNSNLEIIYISKK